MAVSSIFKVAGTLDAVTVEGDFTVPGDSHVVVSNGLTLDGTATLGDAAGIYGYMQFSGSQTLDGSGTVVFSGTNYDGLALTSGTLTIGSDITVRGKSGWVGYDPGLGGSPSNIAVINQGTIQVDTSGSTIEIDGTGSQNAGNLKALNGGTLLLQGTLTNTATVSVDASSVLSLAGTLTGGTIASQAGAHIVGGALDAVTVEGDFTVPEKRKEKRSESKKAPGGTSRAR